MSRPLRIAVFLGTFPVVSETFILRQITGLLDRGHHVRIFAETRGATEGSVQPEVRAYNLLERATFLQIPSASAPWEMPVSPLTGKTWIPGASTPLSNWKRMLEAAPRFAATFPRCPRLVLQTLRQADYGYQAASLSAFYRLAHLARLRERFDLVHAHFGPTGNSFRFLPQLWRIPFITSFHGYDFSSVRQRAGANVYQRLFSVADGITVNSEYMRHGLEAMGCPPQLIHKIPYGIDVNAFPFMVRNRLPSEPFRVLTVGRLVEKKGIEFSIRAFAKAHRSFPAMHYDLVGDGPLKAQLEKLVAEEQLENAVRLRGTRNQIEIRGLLESAHAFVLASVTAADGDQEGTPVSLLEAQAAGLPVLSTHHSGIPEIVLDGQTGFLVPERDVDSLSRRLLELAQQPALCQRLGQAGHAHIAEKFDHPVAIAQLESLYRTVLPPNNHGSHRISSLPAS